MTEQRLCFVCGRVCVAGQCDARNRPAHWGCQASLPANQRHPQLAEYPTPRRHGPATVTGTPPRPR